MMSPRFRKILLIFFVLLSNASFAQVKKIIEPHNLPRRHTIIRVDSGRSSYSLPDSFIIQDSEKIALQDSSLLVKRDYVIQHVEGTLVLLRNFESGTQLNVTYSVFPFRLRKSYYHRKLLYRTDTTETRTIIQPLSLVESREGSALRKNGSIVRGISIGSNQGLKVESGLRMNISGKIADKVEVIAALTDQNTPIQPEGNTQTLNEIDKVFVQLKSDHFNATLGDYVLQFSGSEFGLYERKLQGAMGTANFDDVNVTLSGAVSRGKYITNYFQGQEGNQGPYQLKGDRGQIDIIVLAGTEKVWIDGEPMTRGENNDYVIEYSNGQITFTRLRLITAESRITVDFQYSDLQFQRSLYGAQARTTLLEDKVNLDVRFIREFDNKDNPLNFTLGEENKAILQAAGDQIDSAYTSGARYAGENKGYYIKVDTLDRQLYRYVGAANGDYNVSFSYVGTGKGDYKSIGFGNYQYVGERQGSYAPVILLKAAQRHDLGDVGLVWNVLKGLKISGEVAVSRFDQNTYSALDDDDNGGMAYSAQMNYTADSLNIGNLRLGKLSLNSKYRRVNSRFQYMDRAEEVEKNRKWDSAEAASREEAIKEVRISYQPRDQVAIALGYGDIAKGSQFASRRRDMKMEMSNIKLPQLMYHIEKIESDNATSSRRGEWMRHNGAMSYRFWKLRPFVGYSGEDKKETFQDTVNTGFRYDEFNSGIELNQLKNMSTSFSLIRRKDDSYREGRFRPQSESITQKYEWRYSEKKNLNISLQFIHRDKTFADSSESNKKTDLGEIRIGFTPFNKALSTNWYYQISNTQVAKQERVYFKVAQGEGSYRFNEATAEYEPDDLGDYILRIRQTDDYIPVVELRASSQIGFRPRLFFKNDKKMNRWKKWISAVSANTHIRIEEKTEERDVWDIYRLNLKKFQQPGKTIFGTTSIRQDIHLLENTPDFSVRIRFDRRKEVNYQFLDGGNENRFIENSIRLTRKFSDKLSAQLEAIQSDKTYVYTMRSDKMIAASEVSVDLSYRPKQIMEFALKSKIAVKRDAAMKPETQANDFSLIPSATYSFREKGKLRIEFEGTVVSVSPENRIVPYELVGINRPGTTLRWMMAFDYNVSKYMRATISYHGRREPDRPDIIHVGRAEMRAFF